VFDNSISHVSIQRATLHFGKAPADRTRYNRILAVISQVLVHDEVPYPLVALCALGHALWTRFFVFSQPSSSNANAATFVLAPRVFHDTVVVEVSSEVVVFAAPFTHYFVLRIDCAATATAATTATTATTATAAAL